MSDALSTRDLILEAAITILETEGETGLRVDRVVDAAGFTKPVLYRYFADRDALIVAAQSERYRRSLNAGLQNLTVSVATAQSPKEFIAQLVLGLGEFTSEEGRRRRRLRIEILGSAVQHPELHAAIIEANRRAVDSLGDFLTRLRKAGSIAPKRDPRVLAAWWLSMVSGRYVIDIDSDRFDDDEWTAMLLSTMRFLLTGED